MDPSHSAVTDIFVSLLKSGIPRALAASNAWLHAKGKEIDILNTAGQQYADALERRYNSVKIIGMDRPIPLRDIYVRVNILNKITSSERLTIAHLEKQFNLDRDGFGHVRENWDGSALLSRSGYVLNKKAMKLLRRALDSDDDSRRNQIFTALDDLEGRSFADPEQLLSVLSGRLPDASLNAIRSQEAELLKLSRQRTPNYIVLGKPGAGKTTFLKFLALTALDERPHAKNVPVFVSMKDYADSGKSLLAYIIGEFDICRFPDAAPFVEYMLERGRCVVLCDGLDEVSAESQNRVITELRDAADKYFDCQFLISCRIAAYNHWFARFVDLEIADFGAAQTQTFVRNWFAQDASTASACLERINSRRQTRELATTPLLLTLLCLAYDQAMGFPSNRAELYREGVDALLKKWDASRRIRREDLYKNLSIKRKETLLSDIANTTFSGREYFFGRARLESLVTTFIANLPGVSEEDAVLDAEAVVKAIEAQHGFIVERARDIYSFSHLTFQEYFTAKHIIDRHDSLEQLVESYLKDARWREVVLLVAGLLSQADGLFTAIKATLARLERNLGLSPALKTISAIAAEVQSASSATTRCALFVYWLHHAKVVNSSGRAAYFTTAIQSITDVAGMLDSGHESRLSADAFLATATRVAGRTILPSLLSSNEHFWLSERLHFKPGARRPHRGVGFPIDEIAQYANVLNLVYSCLVSDCYITRELRSSLMDFALTPTA